ncbi:MAG: thioredoxin 1 [Porticoccaceae bacterium]|jgi:thioredoxin 1
MVEVIAMIKLNNNDQIPVIMPSLYDGTDVSKDTLDNFITNTLNEEKQSLFLFGANWCPDAQCLDAILRLPTFESYLNEHFSIMRIDVGEYDRNMSLMEPLGLPSQEGIPRVIVLDLKGEPINLETNDRWRSARQSDPQDIFEYFQNLKRT